MTRFFGALTMILTMGALSCTRASGNVPEFKSFPMPREDLPIAADAGPQTLVLAGGCFWCVEGVYEHIPGVIDVVSGYAGGPAEKANYDAVGGGESGHAEAVQITWDPSKTTYGTLLKVFFAVAHDPTQLNRQGPDTGTQYRSAVFYANEKEKAVVEAYIRQLNEANVFGKPIVTTVEKLDRFFPAEEYHQDFVRNNPGQGYVVQQAIPKVDKAKKAAEELSGSTPTTKPG